MNRIRTALKQEFRGIVNPFLLKYLNRQFSIHDSIVISGFFRSGTTWLAELISESANAGIVFEPFHIENVREAKSAGFTYNNYRHPGDNWPDGYKFVEKVLGGKVVTRWTVSHLPISRALAMQRLVIKLVSSNQMLHWIIEKFDIPTPVLITRHPCAVLASWLSRGWRLNKWVMKDPKLLARYPMLAPILDELSHEEEYFAAKWCIDHYVPLIDQQSQKIRVVAFEKLAFEGPEYLKRILETWGIKLPQKVCERFRQPSEKASAAMATSYESVLGGWRSALSHSQRDRVLQVVDKFGLDFYTDEVEPDYDRLFGGQPVRARPR